MLRDFEIVFDEYVPSTAPVYTSDAFNTLLATYDLVAVQAVVENTSGTGNGTVSIQAQHSATGDGLVVGGGSWIGVDTIINQTIHLGSRESFYGAFGSIAAAQSVFLSYVRLKVVLGGSITAGHVRIYAAMRDASG